MTWGKGRIPARLWWQPCANPRSPRQPYVVDAGSMPRPSMKDDCITRSQDGATDLKCRTLKWHRGIGALRLASVQINRRTELAMTPDGKLHATALALADAYDAVRFEIAPFSFEDRSPLDWSVLLADVSRGDAQTAHLAVQAAHDAFPAWAALGAAGRAEIMHRLADLIDEHVPSLAAVECLDMAMLEESLRLRVLARGARNFRAYADLARDYEERVWSSNGTANRVIRMPAGPTAVISPSSTRTSARRTPSTDTTSALRIARAASMSSPAYLYDNCPLSTTSSPVNAGKGVAICYARMSPRNVYSIAIDSCPTSCECQFSRVVHTATPGCRDPAA